MRRFHLGTAWYRGICLGLPNSPIPTHGRGQWAAYVQPGPPCPADMSPLHCTPSPPFCVPTGQVRKGSTCLEEGSRLPHSRGTRTQRVGQCADLQGLEPRAGSDEGLQDNPGCSSSCLPLPQPQTLPLQLYPLTFSHMCMTAACRAPGRHGKCCLDGSIQGLQEVYLALKGPATWLPACSLHVWLLSE